MADIEPLKKAFAEGIDIHALTASQMFGVPVAGMAPIVRRSRQDDQFRHHLWHRRLRPRPAAEHSPGRGQGLYRRLFRAISGHPGLYGPGQGRGPRQGFVRTLFGRRCYVPEINARSPARRRSYAERAAINAPIQGSAADIMRRR